MCILLDIHYTEREENARVTVIKASKATYLR